MTGVVYHIHCFHDPQALPRKPANQINVTWVRSWVLLPVSIKVTLGPWKDHVIVSVLRKCRQESDKVWVDLAIESFQRVDLVLEFDKSSLPQLFDSKDSAGDIDLRRDQIRIGSRLKKMTKHTALNVSWNS